MIFFTMPLFDAIDRSWSCWDCNRELLPAKSIIIIIIIIKYLLRNNKEFSKKTNLFAIRLVVFFAIHLWKVLFIQIWLHHPSIHPQSLLLFNVVPFTFTMRIQQLLFFCIIICSDINFASLSIYSFFFVFYASFLCGAWLCCCSYYITQFFLLYF